jgi:glutamyl-tRNA reductase
MASADIVVASTAGTKPWLHRADLESVMVARRNRPLFLIDISVPRNIDAAVHHLDNVYLYNIDDLNAIVSENALNRKEELGLCNRIIDDRAAALIEKLNFRKNLNEGGLRFQSRWISGDMVAASV